MPTTRVRFHDPPREFAHHIVDLAHPVVGLQVADGVVVDVAPAFCGRLYRNPSTRALFLADGRQRRPKSAVKHYSPVPGL
jgi:hypothetical protein